MFLLAAAILLFSNQNSSYAADAELKTVPNIDVNIDTSANGSK